MRPEVFHLVLISLEFISILLFRLLSKRANELVKWMFDFQVKINKLIIDPILQQTLQAAQNQLSQMSKAHIFEIKAYFKPLELVERIINLTCMFIESKFKLQKHNWNE
ncbi:unnamed protein product [Paramecium pentaurelia]|uniref:Uncharacterized protein n=1 Tax=Paramecium pentaurelia TaxID=43138 RepID=A0A8S1WJ41_9CILI|nr:unnamed protein product [Paramecium pentaurelia]